MCVCEGFVSYDWRALGATAQGKWSFNVGRSRPNGRTEGETPKKVAFRARTTVKKCRTYSLIPFILQVLGDFTTTMHHTSLRTEVNQIKLGIIVYTLSPNATVLRFRMLDLVEAECMVET